MCAHRQLPTLAAQILSDMEAAQAEGKPPIGQWPLRERRGSKRVAPTCDRLLATRLERSRPSCVSWAELARPGGAWCFEPGEPPRELTVEKGIQSQAERDGGNNRGGKSSATQET